MKSTELLPSLGVFLTLIFGSAHAEINRSSHLPAEEFRWVAGPTTVTLREVGRLKIPEGMAFLNADQAKVLLEGLGNRTSGNEAGLIASESQDWSVVIEFHRVGHVSEAGWESLDAAGVLAAIRASDQGANPERERNGWPVVEVKEWEAAPRYNPTTHTMEWAVHAISGGSSVVNRVISVLSRRGVLQFILVDRHPSADSVSTLRRLVQGLVFEPGEGYADLQPGDPTAHGGLMGLFASSEDPTMLEEPPVQPGAESRRRAPFADYWWLISSVAGSLGFLAGRRRRRHRRGQSHFPVPAPSRSSARQNASTPTTLTLERGSSPTVPGTTTPTPPSPPASPDTRQFRRRRCDAYSFYARLTRDLHWTINR